jgi:hypothetical protein
MAKKKPETAEKTEPKEAKPAKPAEKIAAAPKPAAAKPTAPKAKKAKPHAAPSAPMIDTGLAAETAAKLILAGARPAQANDDENAAPKKESSTFKHLKESLAKPHINSGNPLLGGATGTGNKNKPGFFGGKQIGHNQTFGSGSSRFVPRRTSG